MKSARLWLLVLGAGACTKDPGSAKETGAASPCASAPGCLLAEGLPAGLLSVREGPEPGDIWIVGASPDDAPSEGPVAVHLEGGAWERIDTQAWPGAELWWSWPATDEVVLVGDGGRILELDRADGSLSAVDGPNPDVTFFGVWGSSASDVWAVGGAVGSETPALWRRVDGVWSNAADGLPDGVGVLFKVHGTGPSDIWLVGNGGLALHWDGTAFTDVATDTDLDTRNTPLLTVDAAGAVPVAVGGQGNAVLLEWEDGAWRDHSPDFQPGINGVCAGAGQLWAVGQAGSRSVRGSDGTWVPDLDQGVGALTPEDWHGCLIDQEGALWTAGGRISSRPLIEGVVGYQGSAAPPPLSW